MTTRRWAIAASLALCAALGLRGAAHGQASMPVQGADGEPAGADDAAERIRRFDSRVIVAEDGTMRVTETIAVTAADDQIKRGIYRDFPTIYYTDLELGDGIELPVPHLLRRTVPFQVTEVLRDGHPEAHHSESLENGERVYIGRSEVMLPPGRYTYTITYTTARQLGFFPDHDELYWNVTGNAWAFPIDHADATVVLPPSIPRDRVRLEGYVGPQGSQRRYLTTSIDPQTGELHFATITPLAPHEGLTIVASFPTGYIRAPSAAERRAQLLRDNPVLVIGPAGLLLVMLYYLGAWVKVGRDPARGTIIPLFEPPLGLEPAALRYVAGMGYDERCFTAGLVGLASKGWARIEEKDGEFSLVGTGGKDTGRAALGPGERSLKSALLANGCFQFKQANHATIRAAISSLRGALTREHDGKLFRANRKWVIPGLVLSALAILAAGYSGPLPNSMMFTFMLVWLTGWTFACFHLVISVLRAWRELVRPGQTAFGRIGAGIASIFTTLFALPFLFGEAFGLTLLMHATSLLMAPVLVILVGVNFAFYYLLKQPTVAGRKVMDQIDGFRMYLTTAEGAELAHAAPQKTPRLYEQLLPYAIALGVENEWASQFSDVLARAAQDGESDTLHPSWYTGTSFNRFGSTGFASALSSSLSSSVASSSTAPGSSSGSSGGGSSGGGGGGGGGGGW